MSKGTSIPGNSMLESDIGQIGSASFLNGLYEKGSGGERFSVAFPIVTGHEENLKTTSLPIPKRGSPL